MCIRDRYSTNPETRIGPYLPYTNDLVLVDLEAFSEDNTSIESLNERDQVLFSHPDTQRYIFNILLDDNSGRYEARPLTQDEVVSIQTIELDFRVVPEDLF